MEAINKSSTLLRRKKILSLIAENGQVLVHELSKQFDVSEVTIRNDLEQLEQKKMLLRARGGAMKLELSVGVDHRLTEKDKLHFHEKNAIGKSAAKLINNYDTIIVDSGTTTIEILRNLPAISDITVITNALNIVNQVVSTQGVNISLIIPGGYLRKTSLSMVGPLSEKNLRNFYVDKLFLGVDGFDTRLGIYTPNIEEAHLNEIMIEISKEVIVVADSSKFLRKSLAFICDISKINTVVTDKGISDDDKKRLEDAGIKVIIA